MKGMACAHAYCCIDFGFRTSPGATDLGSDPACSSGLSGCFSTGLAPGCLPCCTFTGRHPCIAGPVACFAETCEDFHQATTNFSFG